MTAGEMERVIVVLQEQRFKVCQRVVFAKDSPDEASAISSLPTY